MQGTQLIQKVGRKQERRKKGRIISGYFGEKQNQLHLLIKGSDDSQYMIVKEKKDVRTAYNR